MAYNWYKSAAELGFIPAQCALAHAYETGRLGQCIDLSLAANWLTRAAEAGHAKAQYRLGLMCVSSCVCSFYSFLLAC